MSDRQKIVAILSNPDSPEYVRFLSRFTAEERRLLLWRYVRLPLMDKLDPNQTPRRPSVKKDVAASLVKKLIEMDLEELDNQED